MKCFILKKTTGSCIAKINFEAVPRIGEYVQINTETYKVTNVIHYFETQHSHKEIRVYVN